MLENDNGHRFVGASAIADRIRRLPESEVEALGEREGILKDVLNSFNARLADLPERDRRAALSMLYKQVADTVFDFHLSLVASAAREKIAKAGSRGDKIDALREFQAMAEDLALLHGISR